MRVVVLVLAAALAASASGCKGESDPGDTGADGDADADGDAALDADDPPLDCGDDPQNWAQCMLPWPDGGPEDGTWCAGQCRPMCGPAAAGAVCPGVLVCHRAGVVGVCFEP